jgi:hypothetical protein
MRASLGAPVGLILRGALFRGSPWQSDTNNTLRSGTAANFVGDNVPAPACVLKWALFNFRIIGLSFPSCFSAQYMRK